MKKNLLLLLPLFFILASCNLFSSFGKKVSFGESEVYYKGDGVTEADAKRLGDFLVEQEFFDKETPKSVQITNDGKDYLVHFVVDKKKVTSAARLNWWKYQYDISKDVFKGKPVRIILADDQLKDIEIMDPVARYEAGKSAFYYDNSQIKKSDVKKLEDFFTEIKLMGDDKETDVFYQKENGSPVVRLVVNPKKITDELLPVFSYWQQLMREKVFDGAKAKLVLTSTKYEDMDSLPNLTAEQRQTFENEAKQTTDNTEAAMDSTTTQTAPPGALRLPHN
ncbi:MAG: hypothetical protein M3Y85_01480 [Bacteroidota bacterium]|nr:hypothetical protein [Bacteroidota bacterium]